MIVLGMVGMPGKRQVGGILLQDNEVWDMEDMTRN
jgi:hypothetical protein